MPETSSPGTRSVWPSTPTFIATARRANMPENTFGAGAPFATAELTRGERRRAAPRSTKSSRKSSYIGNDSMLPPELLP